MISALFCGDSRLAFVYPELTFPERSRAISNRRILGVFFGREHIGDDALAAAVFQNVFV